MTRTASARQARFEQFRANGSGQEPRRGLNGWAVAPDLRSVEAGQARRFDSIVSPEESATARTEEAIRLFERAEITHAAAILREVRLEALSYEDEDRVAAVDEVVSEMRDHLKGYGLEQFNAYFQYPISAEESEAIRLFESGSITHAAAMLRDLRAEAVSDDDKDQVAELDGRASEMRVHLDGEDLENFNTYFGGPRNATTGEVDMTAAFCTECGAPLPPSAKFCAACGAAVPGHSEPDVAPAEAGAAGATSTIPDQRNKTPDGPAPVAAGVARAPGLAPARPPSLIQWPRFSRKAKVFGAIGLVILAIIIASAASGGKKNPRSSANESSSATASPGATVNDAAVSYIRDHGPDANRVQAYVGVVQLQVGILQSSGTQAELNQLAQVAQEAHDGIDGIRNNFATASDSGDLGNAELNVFAGANDLKNAMGGLVAYSGDSNAATLAHFKSQYQSAVGEWNSGIRTIWRMAHRRRPPVL
jgi:hypothetical protein